MFFSVLILLAGETWRDVVPRTIYGIQFLVLFLLAGGSRLLARWWLNEHFQQRFIIENALSRQKVLIYGAGEAGIELAATLKVSKVMWPVAFIDDDQQLVSRQINGLMVYPKAKLHFLIQQYQISEVLLALPHLSRHYRNSIIASLESLPVHVRSLPSFTDVANGKLTINTLQEVDIADLLGRDEVMPIEHLLTENIQHKKVLVTGAGGSIGSELCRQISRLGANTLVLYEQSELALYAIEKELRQQLSSDMTLVAILGNVQDKAHISRIFQQYQIETIYHAAAYKHVPLVEHNIEQGIDNNIFGTLACAQAAIDNEIATFVLISTDKAVRPTNVMGATKRFAELILQALAEIQTNTRFTMVRFGNVLGSSGSVIPLFREQIKAGGPVTVTDPNIIRYFMTIPEAASLVIQAGAMGQGGDVFVLDMGEPVKIIDLAKRMIHLSGYREKIADSDGDIEITYTGLRPGEKLYEELLIGEKVTHTAHQKILRAEERVVRWQQLSQYLLQMQQAIADNDSKQLYRLLAEVVEGYQPVGIPLSHEIKENSSTVVTEKVL
ncbi:MAG TPA: polysaccharide biosynthesis protein [Gammaproteobacteria bacterium]|nr:polysaccharide biosynthesis protein [Gammaproteobacteria bacterium]